MEVEYEAASVGYGIDGWMLSPSVHEEGCQAHIRNRSANIFISECST